jgi:hypothetical protein
MTNIIIPKIAYLPLEFTLPVDEFLKMWDETLGEPTQKDYDNYCRSCAVEVFYGTLSEDIEESIRLRQDN